MPNSVDTIDSSQGQEDHVSFGSNAATKCYRVVNNTERVLAIELFNAVQALDFRKQMTKMHSSNKIEDFVAKYRKVVNFVENDQVMYELIHKSIKFIQDYTPDFE